nr:AAA family ATPase [Streptomyces chartreusis]
MSDEGLLERHAEVAAVGAAIEGLGLGKCSFIAVMASAGGGKTRLLGYVRELLRESSARVLTARGSDFEQEYAFGVVRQLFEPALVRAQADQTAQWFSGAASPAAVLLAASEGGEHSPVGEFAMLNGLAWLTSNLCQDSPLVLIVDDLHWADEASLRFLSFLLPHQQGLPLMLLTATRPAEATASKLVNALITDPSCQLLQPAPLTSRASAALVGSVFGEEPAPSFAQACHDATGGNPLLLVELARAVKAQGGRPKAARSNEVAAIGASAVVRRVALELGRLSSQQKRLAEALSVLGPQADVQTVAALTGLTREQAREGLATLQSASLAEVSEPGASQHGVYRLTHPLVRAAVYDQMPAGQRISAHRKTAQLLMARRAPAQDVAAHLLRLPPGGDADAVAVLRQAAADAFSKGMGEAALPYLRRALAEPPSDETLLPVLLEAGSAALQTNLVEATHNLKAAFDHSEDVQTRASLASGLGLALMWIGSVNEAITVLNTALRELPSTDNDLRRALEATLLDVPFVAVGQQHLFSSLPRLRALPAAQTPGGGLLDCMIGAAAAHIGDPSGLPYLRRGLSNPRLLESISRGALLAVSGPFALVAHNPDEAIKVFAPVMNQARSTGSIAMLCVCYMYRGMAWLRKGELAEAESDLKESLRLQSIAHVSVGNPSLAGFLVEALVEQGRLSDAEAVLRDLKSLGDYESSGTLYYMLQGEARLLSAQGKHEESLKAALSAGARYTEHAGINPAFVAWRSQAALSLHALGRTVEANTYARAECELARTWGAAFSLGRALRIAGRVAPGKDGLILLEESVDVLRSAEVPLEYAYALVEFGAAMRRARSRSKSRERLNEGLAVALQCGAKPLAELAQTELETAGSHVRKPKTIPGMTALTLTPSEKRVAMLAAKGLANREIAQQLFITTKTVEVHLSNVYRKLQVNTRRDLKTRLVEHEG